MSQDPVTVSLQQLEQGLSHGTLESAFGADSLGIILVSGLPSEYIDLRKKVLTSISVLAHLPPDELAKLECEESLWLTGWSRGKETLSETGEPDFNKGSYYVNCAFHTDANLECPSQEITSQFPLAKTYTSPNIWPKKDMPGLEDFEKNCKKLCSLIISVAGQVAKNCDQYISATSDKNYEPGFLQRIVENSTCTKARLLHYYPLENEKNAANSDSWCGEHTDHSCLTGLTSALYIDEAAAPATNPEKNSEKNPETGPGESRVHKQTGKVAPNAESHSGPGAGASQGGLYIRSRRGHAVPVTIPADCLAFQSGAALESISGSLRAVSHYVRGATAPHIARNTLAVFCQPDLNERVNEAENFAQFAERILGRNHGA